MVILSQELRHSRKGLINVQNKDKKEIQQINKYDKELGCKS